MTEPAETRPLSGLARSIDSLFASPPPSPKPSAPVTVVAAPALSPTEVLEPVEAAAGAPPTVVAKPALPPTEVLEPVETAAGAPPSGVAAPALAATQVVGAVDPAAVAWAGSRADGGIPSLPLPEPALPAPPEMFPASQMLEALPAAWLERQPLTQVEAPPPAETLVAEPPEAPGDTTDPEELARAVGDFVRGEADARERVERLAIGLRERLALDPLADAVEALVREAGEPPDARFIDLASAVINPAVASRLVQRLGEESEPERKDAYFGLCRRLGLVMANALKGALTGALDKDVRGTYRAALISMGVVSRPVIEGMVQDDNRFLVRDGVAMLGEIGGPRAVELVTSALADTDARVRSGALLALGRLRDEAAGNLVLGFLEDPDASVREAAAVAAGELGLERALKPLLLMLEAEHDPDRCIPLLRALGQIGDPGAVHAIEKHAVPSLFSKPRTDVRVAAYRALHAIGTPHARELLAKTAHDKDPVVRVTLRDLAGR
jgi:hypothetical protein